MYREFGWMPLGGSGFGWPPDIVDELPLGELQDWIDYIHERREKEVKAYNRGK